MRLRKNALLGAARMIDRIDAIAREHSPHAVGTVGLIENKPNSRNVIPGEVFFTVDFRHPDDKVLDAMETKFRDALCRDLAAHETRLTAKRGSGIRPRSNSRRSSSTACASARQKAGFTSRDMISGAGHDAAYIARVAPTTMIFVPCPGGISHNEAGVDELRGMRRRRAGAAQRGAGV